MELDGFVRAHRLRLVRFAYLLCRDAGRAEDLVQDAFVRLSHPGAREVDDLHAYTRRIVLNEYLAGLRRRSSSEIMVGEIDHVVIVPAAPPTSHELPIDIVLDAIAALPERQRAALVLRYYEDLADADIAGLLGCTQATVRSLASRGAARVRAALDPTPEPHHG